MNIRIIPRLDIKGPNLLKVIHFEGLRVFGKPDYFARYYYENGADELIYMDAVASLYGRNSLLDIVEKTAREIFIPLTVGGGCDPWMISGRYYELGPIRFRSTLPLSPARN